MRPMPRVIAVLTSLALTVGLGTTQAGALAPPAPRATVSPQQTPPPGYPYFSSMTAALQSEIGKTVGPTSATYWGKSTITGFTYNSTRRHWIRTLSIRQYPSPLAAQLAPNTFGPISRGPNMAPNSWYDPRTWNWSHILSVSANTLWNGCLKGAITGFQGGITINAAEVLVTRGAELAIGPEAVPALIIAGCFQNLVALP